MALNRGECHLVGWQYGLNKGSFYGHLMEAISRASSTNLQRLAQGFPEEVEAYTRYISEDGYWDRIVEEARGCGVL